ncbi:DUF1080 domain-containing protein [Dyella monticola]|uniref:DUF1080 domain-containing protein n=1 Tax=Dyella monticola TaxID=1927958 RepID=A0A370WUU6_9GAMM|nr:DUF1080 domain-containing protein [Dyella monticola]RDS79870.1 DUF1080 domain-containing protein [Dyella monticola]
MLHKQKAQGAVAVAGLLLCGLVHAQQHNTLSAQEKSQGWQLLFDGSSLNGWHSYLQKGPGKDWSVRDGAILLEKRPNDPAADFQDLVTNAEYGNFDLKLSWKMSPCADSGVMFYVHESPKYANTYETGPEMQIADLACTKPDSRVLNERSGDLFDIISSDVEWVNEAGQWNQFEIIADHGHVQFFQNGHKVIDTHLWTDDWKRLVAHTKFTAWPDFATFHQGHISLQGTEDKGEVPIHLWFRDIKIKQL